MDLHVEQTLHKFAQLGFTEDMLESDQKGNRIFWNFEIGKISARQFRDSIREITGKNLKNGEINNAWNAMIGGFAAEKIKIIMQLKSKFKLYLLSNTNEIHISLCDRIIKKEYGMNGLNSLFDACFYSYKLGLGKPDPEIFRKVVTSSRIVPGETLYVDDSEEHIKTAIQLGFRTFLFPVNSDLKQIYKQLPVYSS